MRKIKVWVVFIGASMAIEAMNKPIEISVTQDRIKMRIDRIAQLKYSNAMGRIRIAGLKRRLGIYPCSPPQLVVRGDFDSSSWSSDTDSSPDWGLFD